MDSAIQPRVETAQEGDELLFQHQVAKVFFGILPADDLGSEFSSCADVADQQVQAIGRYSLA